MAKKILMLVEGAKKDVRLMKKFNDLYVSEENCEVISYNTNIYELYGQISEYWDEGSFDILQVLKEHEKDEKKKNIFDDIYSDIILVFDFDPQDALYNPKKLRKLMEYFNESTENGRLYINYPMVESYGHFSTTDDVNSFNSRQATFEELKAGLYKKRVDKEGSYSNISKIKIDDANKIISLMKNKVSHILSYSCQCSYETLFDVLLMQIEWLTNKQKMYVLNTCVLYYYEEYMSRD